VENEKNADIDRTERLSFLQRRRRGTVERELLEGLLALESAREWILYPLERSDAICVQIRQSLDLARPMARQPRLIETEDELGRVVLGLFSSRGENERILVMFTRSREIGVLELPLGEFRRIGVDLLRFDKDSLFAFAEGLGEGALLDHYVDGDIASYECRSWSTP